MTVDSLAKRVEQLRESHPGQRVIIAIAGSPGGGKTTLARHLVQRLNEERPGSSVALPMDGYHLSNATLGRLKLRDRKGAIETFDAWGFVSLLRRIRDEQTHTIYAPGFERTVDEGIAGDIAVEEHHEVVIVEGNYVLVDEIPWRTVRDLVTESWFCVTPEPVRLARLVDRHAAFGRSREDAEDWARNVDGVNALLIESTAHNATILVSGETAEILSRA